MGLGWEGDLDGIAGGDEASLQDDGHDASTGDGLIFGGAGHAGVHEAGLEVVELLAGVAKAGDFDDGFGADGEMGAGREVEEIDAGGGDVFA